MVMSSNANQKSQTSLYDRIGGEAAVDTLTMALYAHVNSDDRLAHFFEHIDLMQQINHQKRFLTYALGGSSVVYDMEKLSTAHGKLNLKQEQITAFNEALNAALIDLDVDDDIREKVLAIAIETENNFQKYST